VIFALPLVAPGPTFYVNQVGYERLGPKYAVIGFDAGETPPKSFGLVDSRGMAWFGDLGAPEAVTGWESDKVYCRADFSAFKQKGKYRLITQGVQSDGFEIGDNMLASRTVPSIVSYYRHQRADTPQELAADKKLLLFGSNKTVDLHGGWCDASGDVSKYFSHLAYANFMSPQQTPLVVWSLVNARDSMPDLLTKWGAKQAIEDEARWGADYLLRCLSKDDYFYMIVFSYFDKNPAARRVVGLHADSVTTDEYQSAFREGGGMAIAALARISRWKKGGSYSPAQYLSGAKRAFAHLLKNNTRYDDDGKENIIDDYGALMAASELWIATGDPQYRAEARKRATNLEKRMTPAGYFRADDGQRPYWHASDAGLPIVALARYLDKEADTAYRKPALATIKQTLDYELTITKEVPNPFGYARQTFATKAGIQNGFFIPHENETGWWWQGENARLGSLATAALVGGRLVYPAKTKWGVKPELANFASRQLSWVLGCNPYSMCFMYGFGQKNVPMMKSNFGHGSQNGGISNGITGVGPYGQGIAFKTEDNGNEWRWAEQWLPHSAWFLNALTAMSSGG